MDTIEERIKPYREEAIKQIKTKMSPFTRNFSPLLYFLVKDLQAYQTEHPEGTLTIKDICDRRDLSYPNQYVSEHLRLLHQAGCIELDMLNQHRRRYQFRPVPKIHELADVYD